MTQRYQSGKLQAGWDEFISEMRIAQLMDAETIRALKSVFYAGAVYAATHQKYIEDILHEGLEKFDMKRDYN